MMNFDTIEKYSNFISYQRIKAIKAKQKFDNKGPKSNKFQILGKGTNTYQDYLDKKDGFKCCCVKTCNGCCNYAPIPSISNSVSQSYSNTSMEECICFKGMLEVGQGDLSGTILYRGYTNGSTINSAYPGSAFGYISPNKTCEDLLIAGLFYVETSPYTIVLTLTGDTFGDTIWTCLILTQGSTTIRLRKLSSSPPNKTDTGILYSWDNVNIIEKFTTGKQWCVMLTQ